MLVIKKRSRRREEIWIRDSNFWGLNVNDQNLLDLRINFILNIEVKLTRTVAIYILSSIFKLE